MSGCPDWHLLDSLYGSNYHREKGNLNLSMKMFNR